MKKTYIAPMLKEKKTISEQLICVSVEQQGDFKPSEMTITDKDDELFNDDLW